MGRHTVPLLRTWREQHPEVRVEIRRLDDLEAALWRGQADLAFLCVRPLIPARSRWPRSPANSVYSKGSQRIKVLLRVIRLVVVI
ncbi:LysR substrate-binding domain-containing protein [Streptomyces collinus]|uniref:LysR substrate-binding domain-containing protein n=1 Tax=Streptomyces collinus TaxID=42684 RepID=UPI0036C5DEA1